MSEETAFTIRKAYVLSAINKEGQRVYYDTDSHSGGYPYWSTSDYDIEQFDSLDEIPTFSGTDYMRRNVVSIEVLEIKLQAKVVQTTKIMSEAQ